MLYQALAVHFYNRPKLLPISLNPNPRSSVTTQESSLVKLKEGKSHKTNPQAGIFVLAVMELQKMQCQKILQTASCYLDVLI